jgi:hypothetical protein
VQRGEAPLLGVLGYPPTPKVPQDWGIKGVEKEFIKDFYLKNSIMNWD